jgi:hypothetical protein
VRLGANLRAVVMDEPLLNVLLNPDMNRLGGNDEKFEFALEHTADYIRKVHGAHPTLAVGDIEVFPTMRADFVIRWIDALDARLAEKGTRRLDFFRLDVNWLNLAMIQEGYTPAEGWREVKRINDHCKAVGLPFSLIYWPADVLTFEDKDRLPIMDSRSDKAWHDQIMAMARMYWEVGGRPDQYVMESWVRVGPKETPMPPTVLPERHVFSFTRCLKELYENYAGPQLEGK